MKNLASLLVFMLAPMLVNATGLTPPIPIKDGEYTFQHKYAEHPNMPSFRVQVTIKGNRITLVNNEKDDVFPIGVIDEGVLTWHARSMQWIIAHGPGDANAEEAGGCSDGPEVVDLVKLIYWTC